MTSEHTTAETLEGTGEGIPPLHYGALSRWLAAHPELVGQFFEVKSFKQETRIFPSVELLAAGLPRLAIMLSGELTVTQLFPGSLVPHRAIYRGDLWVNPNLPSKVPPEPMPAVRIEAVTASRILVLSEKGLRSMPAQQAEELEKILADYSELHGSRRTFFQALRNTIQFQKAGVRHLHALLDTADVRTYEAARGQEIVIPQGSTDEAHKGIFLLLEGQLGEWRDPPPGTQGESVLTRALYPGSIFGDVVLHTNAPPPCTVRLHSSKARVAVLPEKNSLKLLSRFPLLAGTVSPSPADIWQRITEVFAELGPPPEVVLFRTDVPGVPLDTWIQFVAEATHQSYKDHILHVELAFSSKAIPPEPPPEFRPGQVPTYRLSAENGGEATRALQQLAKTLRGKWDYFFVHVDPRLWKGLVPPEGSAPGFRPILEGEVTWKLVSLSRDPLASVPPPGFHQGSILHAALLQPGTERVEGPAFPAGTVRLTLDPKDTAGRQSFSQLSSHERHIFERWARGITERLVGIALGAGGSWGYAEIAVIRGMLERKIPIDILSGTSFGSVAGAFYSSLGLEGLDLLLEKGNTFLGIIAVSMINSSAMTYAFDRILDHRRLEKTPLPFFPVGTNVSESHAFVLQRGTLGAAVRSSGIMPGLLSPDFTEDACRVVDGAFINSVPASVLVSQRANLIIATNVLSAPPDAKDSKPLLPGRLGWFIHGLNPIGRMSDLMRSTLILFHAGGNKDSYGADVVFDMPFTSLPPWAFGKGQAFVDSAAKIVGPTLDEIETRWKIMSMRRGDLISKVLSIGQSFMQGRTAGKLTEKVPA
jgi:predicted acylesterase/phospholipase RssA